MFPVSHLGGSFDGCPLHPPTVSFADDGEIAGVFSRFVYRDGFLYFRHGQISSRLCTFHKTCSTF